MPSLLTIADIDRAVAMSQDRVEVIKADGTIASINQAGLRAFEAGDGSGLIGAQWSDLWPIQYRQLARDRLSAAQAGQTARFSALGGAGSGHRWWDMILTPTERAEVLVIGRDITEAKAVEDELRRLTRHDGLTGLLNRTALIGEIDEALARSAIDGRQGAVAVLDLDNFKLINDTLGHDAGDAVLGAVAAGLRDVVGSANLVARLGGDEFALLFVDVDNLDRVRVVLEAVLARLAEPISFKGRNLNARASVGVALFPKHGTQALALLKCADIALFAAKSFGRGGYVAYVPSMGGPIRRRAAAVSAVSDALADNRVDSFYEPMVDLRSGTLIGFEAKLNVRLANGQIMPAEGLAPVFDDIELARALGNRILMRVTDDAQTWVRHGLAIDRIAINAAAAEFRAGDYAERFLNRLADANLPPTMFAVEVCETVFAGRGTDYVASALKTLNDAGVRVALDQFGSGAAALSHLKRLSIDAVKIDGGLVQAIETDAGDRAVVRAMIGLASGFGLGLAVDGVETSSQAASLQALGCEVGQGKLFGVAADSASVIERLSQGPSPSAARAVAAGA